MFEYLEEQPARYFSGFIGKRYCRNIKFYLLRLSEEQKNKGYELIYERNFGDWVNRSFKRIIKAVDSPVWQSGRSGGWAVLDIPVVDKSDPEYDPEFVRQTYHKVKIFNDALDIEIKALGTWLQSKIDNPPMTQDDVLNNKKLFQNFIWIEPEDGYDQAYRELIGMKFYMFREYGDDYIDVVWKVTDFYGIVKGVPEYRAECLFKKLETNAVTVTLQELKDELLVQLAGVQSYYLEQPDGI